MFNPHTSNHRRSSVPAPLPASFRLQRIALEPNPATGVGLGCGFWCRHSLTSRTQVLIKSCERNHQNLKQQRRAFAPHRNCKQSEGPATHSAECLLHGFEEISQQQGIVCGRQRITRRFPPEASATVIPSLLAFLPRL